MHIIAILFATSWLQANFSGHDTYWIHNNVIIIIAAGNKLLFKICHYMFRSVHDTHRIDIYT